MDSGISCGLCAWMFSWLAFSVKVRAEALYSGVSFTTGVPACRRYRTRCWGWDRYLELLGSNTQAGAFGPFARSIWTFCHCAG